MVIFTKQVKIPFITPSLTKMLGLSSRPLFYGPLSFKTLIINSHTYC